MPLSAQYDALLGSPARVKTLRVLSRFPTREATGRELAALAGASPPQTLAALKAFAAQGLVRHRRAGSATLWALNPDHALVPRLRALFDQERALREELLRDVRAGLVGPGIRRAIVFGSFARGDDGPTSDVDLYVSLDTERNRPAVEERLARLCRLVFRRYGRVLSPLLYGPEEAKQGPSARLLRSIQADALPVGST